MRTKKVLILVPCSKQTENVPRDLVYGCWCAGKRIGGIKFPPLTSVLIATILRKEGIDIDFRDLAGESKSMEVLDSIINNYTALVLLTSTMTIEEDSLVLSNLKQMNPNLLTIVWGSHPTFLPKQTLSKDGIDIAVRGEGDYIIRDLILKYIAGEDWHNVLGIGYKSGEDIIINPDRPFIKNLDELPFPDRGMLSPQADYFNPVVKRAPYTTMYTTRGCPGRCTFCTVPRFYGGKVRFRSSTNILEELKMVAKLGYKEVFFRDEIFTASKKRLLETAKGIIENRLDITWICSARVGSLDEEMIKIMKESGCHMIRIGVESGVQEILDNVKKGIKIKETEKLMALAHKYRLEVHAHVMIGMPGDNAETLNQTIKFVKKINPSVVTFGICTPYPGTPLYEEVKKVNPDIEDGSACNLAKLHREGFFNSVFCDLTEQELGKWVKKAYAGFYMQPRYLFGRLIAIRSWSDLKKDIKAGLKVFSFSLGK